MTLYRGADAEDEWAEGKAIAPKPASRSASGVSGGSGGGSVAGSSAGSVNNAKPTTSGGSGSAGWDEKSEGGDSDWGEDDNWAPGPSNPTPPVPKAAPRGGGRV